MPRLDTVTIDKDGQPVKINKADFDGRKHTVYGEQKKKPGPKPKTEKADE